MTLVQVATLFVGTATMYYTYFSIIEIVTTATIVWIGLKKWKVDAWRPAAGGARDELTLRRQHRRHHIGPALPDRHPRDSAEDRGKKDPRHRVG